MDVAKKSKGPTKEKAMLGPPDRWLYCPKMGEIFADTFIPLKTPLCALYDDQIEARLRFHPKDVFDRFKGKKIGLWIDLTKTDRYYSSDEIEKHGCQYRKVALTGHKETPQPDEVERFICLVSGFRMDHPNELIAVHCTHGFNRTGFVISAYMYQKEDWAIDEAITRFAASRHGGIYKQDYINDLFKRYGYEGDEPFEAPEKPKWEFNEECFSLESPQLPGTSQSGSNGASNGNGATATAPGGKVFAEGKVEGQLLTDDGLKKQLRARIRELCRYGRDGFPGSQPVSMEKSPERDNLKFLAMRRYMVSWKADGMRYLIYINGPGEVYAFDRDNEIFRLPRLTFPHRTLPRHIENTLVDSELIFDKQPDGHEIPRILIYDIITFEGMNLAKENFEMRMQCIHKEIENSRNKAAELGQLNKEAELCSVRHKQFWPILTTRKIFDPKFTCNLGHEVDGLIFQPVDEPYVCGRCDTVLKWKPPSHNSIDFKLQIRKVQPHGELPRYVGFLYVQHCAEPFDQMRALKSLQPYDGKIIECKRSDDGKEWQFMRERTDKSLPNSIKTAQAVINSMKYPIHQVDLCNFIDMYGYRGPPQPMQPPPPPKKAKRENDRRERPEKKEKRGKREEEEEETL